MPELAESEVYGAKQFIPGHKGANEIVDFGMSSERRRIRLAGLCSQQCPRVLGVRLNLKHKDVHLARLKCPQYGSSILV
jgi:hypothetical protein